MAPFGIGYGLLLVGLVVDIGDRSARKLAVQRLSIRDASAPEPRPWRNANLGIDPLGEQLPELRVDLHLKRGPEGSRSARLRGSGQFRTAPSLHHLRPQPGALVQNPTLGSVTPAHRDHIRVRA